MVRTEGSSFANASGGREVDFALSSIKLVVRSFSEGLCGRRDSNPQALRHMHLKHARIPIPPRPPKIIQTIRTYPNTTNILRNYKKFMKV